MKYCITRMQLISLVPARVWGVASMDCDSERHWHWPCCGLRPAQHLVAFLMMWLLLPMEEAPARVSNPKRKNSADPGPSHSWHTTGVILVQTHCTTRMMARE
jgi:hypothetical protein